MFNKLNPLLRFSSLHSRRFFSEAIDKVRFDILMPNLQHKQVFIDRNKTFKDMEDEIKRENTSTTLEFRTYDYSIISKANDIDSALNSGGPIFVKVNSMEWQQLQDKDIQLDNEEHRLKQHYTHDVKQELDSLRNKVAAMNKNHVLPPQDLDKITLDLLKIKSFYNSQSISDTLSQFRNLTDLFESYYKLKSEFAKLSLTKSELLNKCAVKAKLLIALGGILFITELILIYYGVFVIYSWDIVEPITYLVGCANFVLVIYYRKKLGSLSAHQYYTQKFFNKLIKRKKFNEELYSSTERKIKDIERILNK